MTDEKITPLRAYIERVFSKKLTLAAVARRLGCTRHYVTKLVQGRIPDTRPLPTLKRGRRWVVREYDLNTWLNEHTTLTMAHNTTDGAGGRDGA